jgi:DNA invertase Pin-like site-specific DNA recombinase
MIPARKTIHDSNRQTINQNVKRRVAGYARVSTNREEQENSFDAQVKYYTNYIQSRDDWEFISVYTDEGISATSTAKREGFNRMVADALDGKIDLIITKSVSRFARNTVDSLSTIRKLKEHGVEVYFEKENIWTFDGKGELLITIMSSLAQEESRSISENCTWGQRKRFSDGKVSVPYSRFLGYDKGENGTLRINEEEAVIVRLIYKMFLEGATPHGIAKHLTEKGISSPGGKEIWGASTIRSILSNEKMKGDALLQKSYTIDFLTKKKKRNEGDVPQYYVENAHPAIIDPAVFDMVQQEMEKRKPGENRHSGVGIFASSIKCGDCGSWYGSKIWHSNSKYRRTVYQCNYKFKKGTKCNTPHFSEDDLKRLFVEAFNTLQANRDDITENCEEIISILTDTSLLDKKADTLKDECAAVEELIRKSVEENARVAQNQNEYNRCYNELVSRYEAAEKQLEDIHNEKQARYARRETIKVFFAELEKRGGLINEFDEELWCATVDSVLANKKTVAFIFKDGTVIEMDI